MLLLSFKFIALVAVIGLSISGWATASAIKKIPSYSNPMICTRPGDKYRCPYTKPVHTFSTCGIHVPGESCKSFCMSLMMRSLDGTCYYRPPPHQNYLEMYEQCHEQCMEANKSHKKNPNDMNTAVKISLTYPPRVGGGTRGSINCAVCKDCFIVKCDRYCYTGCPLFRR